MRKAEIYYRDTLAGILTETDDGEYLFRYEKRYIAKHPAQFLTFSMPVTEHVYRSRYLFPFFEGLIPEGWLLDIASESWKIDHGDRMGLLLVCCKSCIGAVSVVPIETENE
jgi:serine/threonine-protein kinase HipA